METCVGRSGLAGCHGYAVTADGAAIGVVETPLFGGAQVEPDYLLVRLLPPFGAGFRVVPAAWAVDVDRTARRVAVDGPTAAVGRLPRRLPVVRDRVAAEQPDYRCDGCNYGVASPASPPACPMCGGGAWTFGSGRSRSHRVRHGAAAVVIEPLEPLDATTRPLLADAVAVHAAEGGRILLDLSALGSVTSEDSSFLADLTAVVGSRARLLVCCRTGPPKRQAATSL
jgi:hypothetical protein